MTTRDFKRFFSQYKILALLLAIAMIWLFFEQLTDGAFLTPRNFSNLLRQMAITGMLASGMVFIIISGEIDLSVGASLGLLGGIAAILDYTYQLPMPLIILIVVALGIGIGLFNGYWVAYLRVPSFIVSLAGFLAFRGILLGITKGTTVPLESEPMIMIGQAYLPMMLGNFLGVAVFALMAFLTFRTRAGRAQHGLAVPPLWQDLGKLGVIGVLIVGFVYTLNQYEGIPVPVLVTLVILGVFSFMANQTVFGRRIYSVGSNLEATRLSGVNVRAVKMLVFGMMGLMAAFAGLTTTARLAAGSPSAGTLGELDAIASCFIGGASSRGGVGTVYGALIGALIMASLDNGMSMLGVESFWQMIVKGAILLLAVWIDVVSGAGSER
ncbi:sugar ABC transporter permease [Propionivibrio sp.]|jgi:D-xylose transport system permease protein|uniref:sugar ABC transporter permease n=1 Tax=Propionivibrio sp. TaxID=2212460 RepID=UPI00272DDEBD|nr:sugar ABC transporter permease [Propionivibrio sp.]